MDGFQWNGFLQQPAAHTICSRKSCLGRHGARAPPHTEDFIGSCHVSAGWWAGARVPGVSAQQGGASKSSVYSEEMNNDTNILWAEKNTT